MSLFDIPLCLVLGVEQAFVWLYAWASASFPTFNQIIGSFWIFLILWYPRNYLEKRYLKRRFGRKNANRPPSPSDHQAAASSIGNLFNHH